MAIAIILLLIFHLDALAGEKLRYAVFSAPPFMIGLDNKDEEISGIDVEIVENIARRMDLEIEFVRCSWARCLWLMQSGDVDLLSSVWKRVEREKYLLYPDAPFLDRLPITFYFRKGSGYAVNSYDDLYRLPSVGVLRGAGYFKRFDQDQRVKKVEFTSQDQLLMMLEGGRLAAIAGYVPTANYHLLVEGYGGKVERAEFEFADPEPVYLAISRKSPFSKRFAEFNAVNSSLVAEGLIEKIREKYYRRYSPQF